MTLLDPTVLLAITLMALTTYLPRFFPLLILSRRKLPALLECWLSYVPVAVLAALLGPVLLAPEGYLNLLPASNLYFWAAIPCLIAALNTKNMFITVLVGMGSMALLRFII